MSIVILGELGQANSLSFKAPLDSTLIIKGFGKGNNNTSWRVYTQSAGCLFFCATTTLPEGNFYKPLTVTETGNYILSY